MLTMRIQFASLLYLFMCFVGKVQLTPKCVEAGRCKCCKTGICDDVDFCINGCIDTFWGHRCKNRCVGNCKVCSQAFGKICYECQDTFYDKATHCNKGCSVGCVGGNCHDDGSCLCLDNFEGVKCDSCIVGKYDENCTSDCITHNCRCSDQHGCDSCQVGHYGPNCEHVCSIGCFNDKCSKNSGECIFGCVSNFYGSNCDKECPYTCKPSDLNLRCNGTEKCLHGCIDGYSGNSCDSFRTPQGLTTGVGVGSFIAGLIVAIPVMVILFRRRTSRAKTTGRENHFTHMSIIEVQDESRTVGSYETPVQGDQTKHDYDPLCFSTYVQSKDNDNNYTENAHVYKNQ